ncbi:hypothetical protein Ga0100230_003760 [Opitutaceae bacterium TAV3]|nr:hypothetical protein Ga0100230_003760 [Opitutaceae bacterium TAV3]
MLTQLKLSLGAWELGSLGAWELGSLGAWELGSLGAWELCVVPYVAFKLIFKQLAGLTQVVSVVR